MNKAEIRQIILEEIENAIDDMATKDSTETTPVTDSDAKNFLKGIIALFNPAEASIEEMAGRSSEKWYVTPKMDTFLQKIAGQTGVEGLVAAIQKAHERLTTQGKKTPLIKFSDPRNKKGSKSYFADPVTGELDMVKVKAFAELIYNPEGFTNTELRAFFPKFDKEGNPKLKKGGEPDTRDTGEFKRALGNLGAKLIALEKPGNEEEVSESKKKLEFDFSQVETPEKLPIDVEEQDLMDNIKMELKSSADDYQNDNNTKTAQQLKDAINWVDKNGLTGKVTIGEIYNFLTEFHKQLPGDDKMFLHEPTILELVEDEFRPYVDTEEEYQKIVSSIKQYLSSKQPQEMSELEKYIKQVIKEAKNPLANRMKEIENQGRIAALETKLSAISEFIEETQSRLTRIDEDEEFNEMMDRSKVKEVRKQLKELERAQAKLQKEYDKAAGGRKQEKVVDELDAEETRAKADKFDDLADRQDALDQEAGEVEEVSFDLNESVKRMQKLANLKG